MSSSGGTRDLGRVMNRSVRALARVVAAALAASACSDAPWRSDDRPWEGFVYPKTGRAPYDVVIGRFASLRECRIAARSVLAHIEAEEGAVSDYECGRDCRLLDESTLPPPGRAPMRICKETLR